MGEGGGGIKGCLELPQKAIHNGESGFLLCRKKHLIIAIEFSLGARHQILTFPHCHCH